MTRDHHALKHILTPLKISLHHLHRADHLINADAKRLVNNLRVGLREHLLRHYPFAKTSSDHIIDRFLNEHVIGCVWVGDCVDHPETFIRQIVDRFDRYIRQYEKPLNADSDTDTEPVAPEQCESLPVIRERWAIEVFKEAVDRLSAECDSTGQADVWSAFERWLDNPPHSGLTDAYVHMSNNDLNRAKDMFKRHLRVALTQRLGGEGVIRAEIAIILEQLESRGWLGDHDT